MRTWVRSAGLVFCGNCPTEIKRGDPVLLIELPGVRRVRVRCVECAGEPVPDLPAAIERVSPPPTPMHRVREIAGLPLDWAQRAAGEREPGSDG